MFLSIVNWQKNFWSAIFSLFGVEWVMPRRVIELDCWRAHVGSCFSFSRLKDGDSRK
jgi:hypothetical protein